MTAVEGEASSSREDAQGGGSPGSLAQVTTDATSDGEKDSELEIPSDNFVPALSLSQLGILGFFLWTMAISFAIFPAVVNLAYLLSGKLSVVDYTVITAGIDTGMTYFNMFVSAEGDKIVTPYGRRKPFVFVGSLLMLTGATVICFPIPGLTDLATQVALAYAILSMGKSFFGYSINSWIIEIAVTQSDFVRFQVVALLSIFFGAVPVLGLSFFTRDNPGPALLVLFFIFMPCGLLSLFLLMKYIPSPKLEAAPKQFGLVPSLRSCLRLKEFRTLFSNTILLNLATVCGVAYPQRANLYLCYGMKTMKDVANIIPFMFPVFIALMAGSLVAWYVINKGVTEKIKFYQFVTAGSIVSLVVVGCTLLPSVFDYVTPVSRLVYVIMLVLSIIFSCLAAFFGQQMAFAYGLLFRDLVKLDNFIYDVDRENMFQIAFNTPQTLLAGIFGNLFTAMLFATGLSVEETGDEGEDTSIRDVYSWNVGTNLQMFLSGTLVIGALGYWGWSYMQNPPYPLTTELADKISESLEKRNAIKAEKAAAAKLHVKITPGTTHNPTLENDTSSSVKEDDAIPPSSRELELKEEMAAVEELDIKKRDMLSQEDWNYLGDDEVQHVAMIAAAATAETSEDDLKAGLDDIIMYPKVGAFFLSPLALVAIVISISFQYVQKSDPPFALMTIALFQTVSLYEYYELGRYWAITRLSKMAPGAFVESTKAARDALVKYSVSLQELLDEGVVQEHLDKEDGDTGIRLTEVQIKRKEKGLKSKSSSTAELRSTLILSSEVEIEPRDKMHGYKRIFSVLVAIIILSVIVVVV